MNQLKSIYNSPFRDSHSHPIHTCFPIIASNTVLYNFTMSRPITMYFNRVYFRPRGRLSSRLELLLRIPRSPQTSQSPQAPRVHRTCVHAERSARLKRWVFLLTEPVSMQRSPSILIELHSSFLRSNSFLKDLEDGQTVIKLFHVNNQKLLILSDLSESFDIPAGCQKRSALTFSSCHF